MPCKFDKLREEEEKLRLILLTFTKDDVDEMVYETDENDEDVYFNLTDEQWDEIRHLFYKRMNGVMGLIWDTLDGIAREVKESR